MSRNQGRTASRTAAPAAASTAAAPATAPAAAAPEAAAAPAQLGLLPAEGEGAVEGVVDQTIGDGAAAGEQITGGVDAAAEPVAAAAEEPAAEEPAAEEPAAEEPAAEEPAAEEPAAEEPAAEEPAPFEAAHAALDLDDEAAEAEIHPEDRAPPGESIPHPYDYPQLGLPVLFKEHQRTFGGGQTLAPAIVARVHDRLTVTLQVLPANGEPYVREFVPFSPNPEFARAPRAWGWPQAVEPPEDDAED